MHSLITGDLCVRPFVAEDAPAFAAAARESAASLHDWMPWCHAGYSVAEAQAWMDLCEQNRHASLAWDVGIFRTVDQRLLGGIGVNQINRLHNCGNVGYWVRQSEQGKGIATASVRMIAAYGFAELKLTRLEILAAENNHASRRVALKAGAWFECLARNRLVLRGMPYTAAVHSLVPP
jgi:RimJ/RimL family protein N-acetyltransferase